MKEHRLYFDLYHAHNGEIEMLFQEFMFGLTGSWGSVWVGEESVSSPDSSSGSCHNLTIPSSAPVASKRSSNGEKVKSVRKAEWAAIIGKWRKRPWLWRGRNATEPTPVVIYLDVTKTPLPNIFLRWRLSQGMQQAAGQPLLLRRKSLTVGVVDEGYILRAGRDMVRRRSKVGTNWKIVDPHLFIGDHDVLKKAETLRIVLNIPPFCKHGWRHSYICSPWTDSSCLGCLRPRFGVWPHPPRWCA